VGYHGRASSIIPSGVPIHRPSGQTLPNDATSPIFGPSKMLDFELEMGFVIGKDTKMGSTISTENAEDYILALRTHLFMKDFNTKLINTYINEVVIFNMNRLIKENVRVYEKNPKEIVNEND
jgi:hypothetical protein